MASNLPERWNGGVVSRAVTEYRINKALDRYETKAFLAKSKEQVEYSIVGSSEANPRRGRLSNESPVGKALLGRKKGEKVTVPAPRGAIEYQVVKIEAGDAGD